MSSTASSYDPHALLHPTVDRSWRRLPRLIGQAFSLVWQADRADVIIVAVLQALGGVLLVAQLLVIRGVLGEVVARRSDLAALTVGAIAPDLLVLAVISGLSVIASAACSPTGPAQR